MISIEQIRERFLQIRALLETAPDNKDVLEDLEFYAFIASLLPIPGAQQAAEVVHRATTKKLHDKEMGELRKKLFGLSERLEKVTQATDWLFEATQAARVLQQSIAELAELLTKTPEADSEFVVDTADWSTQLILNTLIRADRAAFLATNNSANVIKRSRVEARKTHLRAHNHSTNIVDDAEFTDGSGGVGMKGIRQTGDVSLEGPSMGFGSQSAVNMGPWYMGTDEKGDFVIGVRKNPDDQPLVAQCPRCHHKVQTTRGRIRAAGVLTCPVCGFSAPV